LEQDDNYDSLHNIQRIYGNEDDRTGLQPIHALLYAAISRKLFKLRSKRASLDPKQYDEIEKLKRFLGIISQKRLPKILRVALSGAYKDKRNEMTLEERWLCEELSKIISEWKKNLFL
jgi:DNA replication initiation complex subunit (GINS family)